MSEIVSQDEPKKKPTVRHSELEPQPSRYLGPAPEPPRIGKASIVLIVLVLVIVGSIVGSCYMAYSMATSVADMPGRVIGGIRDALDAGDPTYITLPAVIEQLKPLSRLQTEEYFLSTVVDVSQPRGTGGVLTEKLVLIACGRVTAGVDLSKITDDDIHAEGTKVIITMPPAELFDWSLDDESGCTRVYDRSVPVLMAPTEALEEQARREALASFRETALDNGILERANLRAQEEIARLLLLAGYETVEFSDSGQKIELPQE